MNSGVWALGSFAARDHLLCVQEVIWNGFPAFFTGYLCFVNSPREVGILTVAQKPRQVSCVPILTPCSSTLRIASKGELYKLLGYSTWQKFQHAIEEAKIACENSEQAISDHFNLQVNSIPAGKGAKRKTEDYHLTRYACYLIVQNADPSNTNMRSNRYYCFALASISLPFKYVSLNAYWYKPIVALGQTYFAYQTRRQEIADELALTTLPEDQKRIILRSMLATFNTRLQEAAQQAGVIEPRDFATFYDHGYMGLYGGLKENDIHAQKGLMSDKQKISDYMGSEELGANIFRATQADAKLRRDQVGTKGQANITHYRVGQEVREAIKRLGGTMPEYLPTPDKSIQELQREEQQRLKQGQQSPLLDNPDEGWQA